MLTDELEAYRSTVRQRAEARLAPLAGPLDRDQCVSAEVWAELRDMEVLSLPLPARVGGLDGSFLAFVVATEEIARVSAGAALYRGRPCRSPGPCSPTARASRLTGGYRGWPRARHRRRGRSPSPTPGRTLAS
jgi:hypothetical protein